MKREAREKTAIKTARPSPRSGVALPVGAHPGNTGGKAGRSGRKPDAFREQLESIRDEHGLDTLREILGGTVTYNLNAICEHCGKTSKGPETFGDVLRLAPSVDAKLRASDLTMRYTVGLEKTIRLEGFHGVREAFELIKGRIRAMLAPEMAALLIDDIQQHLKTL